MVWKYPGIDSLPINLFCFSLSGLPVLAEVAVCSTWVQLGVESRWMEHQILIPYQEESGGLVSVYAQSVGLLPPRRQHGHHTASSPNRNGYRTGVKIEIRWNPFTMPTVISSCTKWLKAIKKWRRRFQLGLEKPNDKRALLFLSRGATNQTSETSSPCSESQVYQRMGWKELVVFIYQEKDLRIWEEASKSIC